MDGYNLNLHVPPPPQHTHMVENAHMPSNISGQTLIFLIHVLESLKDYYLYGHSLPVIWLYEQIH